MLSNLTNFRDFWILRFFVGYNILIKPTKDSITVIPKENMIEMKKYSAQNYTDAIAYMRLTHAALL